jgi:F-type H+-transporting ATPase subunit gamma
MAVSAKNIRIRIRSIKNTKKITKAMELVSANKMRKASKLAVSGRPYDVSTSDIIKVILDTGLNGPFFREPQVQNKKVAVVLFSSNRGLCGSFNTEIVLKTRQEIYKRFSGQDIRWITIGKKGSLILSKNGENVFAEFPKIESGEDAFEFFNIAKFLTEEFLNQNFTEVWFAYMDFISSIKQIPRLKRLLPLQKDLLDLDSKENKEGNGSEIKFEPSKEDVLTFLVPRLIETKLYHALLESNASEHSARMMAMKNASDASKDLIDDLTFKSNDLRQASITREIIEIAGAKSAIES